MAVLVNIILAQLTMTFLGAVFGLGLGLFPPWSRSGGSTKLGELLPGLNCGICGFPSCLAYGRALERKEADVHLCAPGGEKVEKALAKFLGLAVSYTEEDIVQIHCRGGDRMGAVRACDPRCIVPNGAPLVLEKNVKA